MEFRASSSICWLVQKAYPWPLRLMVLCGYLLSFSLSFSYEQKIVRSDKTWLWIISSINIFVHSHISSISCIANSEPSNMSSVSSVMSWLCKLWHAWTIGSIQYLWIPPSSLCFLLLTLHAFSSGSPCHLTHALSRQNAEILFDVMHAFHWGDFLLCTLFLHLSTPEITLISIRGQGSGSSTPSKSQS